MSFSEVKQNIGSRHKKKKIKLQKMEFDSAQKKVTT